MKSCCCQNLLAKFGCLAAWLVFCLCSSAPAVIAEIQPDFLMDSDPELPIPQPVKNFNPRMAALWMEALERPEADMQRMAAETIARAHRYGIPDLNKAIPQLEQILLAESSHPAARFAAARALIVLESRDSGQKLFQASQSFGANLRQLVEPTLATWDNASARSVWLERLKDVETEPQDLILAMRGLGSVRELSALENLLSIASDRLRNSAIRIEAATAAGNMAETGLEQRADRLALDPRASLFVNQICAVRLLAHHSSESARKTLTELAGHEEPAVVATALQRLNGIDFSLVLPLAESAIQSSDPQVRRQGAISILQLQSADHIASLSRLLADPNPDLRRLVCDGLHQLASHAELNELVLNAAMQALAGDSWQGHEQAALLLGALEHQPAANRLVELLKSPRMEVEIASAWALRKVAVQETIPALIDQAKHLTELRNVKGDSPELDQEITHLFEALGVLNAADAAPLLMKYVPKRAGWQLSRGGAIWALGRLNAGTPNPEVVTALADRIMDFEPQPKESSLVKQMSVVALGRMRAVDQTPMLKLFANGENVDMRNQLAIGWAVKELTGEELPPPEPLPIDQGEWFLEPLP